MEHINLEFFFNLEREGKKSIFDFCVKMGFIAGSYECPECKNPMRLIFHKDGGQDGLVWRCNHPKNLIVRRSIKNGSWFQNSHLPVIQMLKLAYLWIKRTKHAWITDELKININTVTDWASFFRKVCVNAIKKGIFLGGPNVIVEIDAKSFPNIKNKLGCETWVFGGVDRSTKKCFLEIIHTGEEEEILRILQKYVLPGSTIISDSWSGFDCLENNGYVHQKVCKSFGFKDPITGAHKNNILGLWSKLKKIVVFRITGDQFDTYLAEIMWRTLHQEKTTQELLMSFFKILTHIFTPRVQDDPSYISRKIEIENKNDDDCMRTQTDEAKISHFEGGTQSEEAKISFFEGEMISSSTSVHEDSIEIQEPMLNEKEMISSSNSVHEDNNQIQEPMLKEKEMISSCNSVHEDSIQTQEPMIKEKETGSKEVNGYNNEGSMTYGTACDRQIFENQIFEEIEVPLVYSGDSLTEGEFQGEIGSEKKRLKTMESLDP